MRRLLIPGIVVAGLAAALFWWDLPREKRSEDSQHELLRLTRLDPELVDTLRIVRDGERIELVRRQGDWWLSAPLEERADDASVQGMLNILCRASVTRIISADVDTTALDAFGLGGLRPPQRWVELRAPGREPVVYDLGRKNPSGSAMYMRVRGRDEVMLVDLGMGEIGRTSHQAFRIYDLFDVQTEEIEAITLHTPRGSFTVRRNVRGLWFTDEDSPRQVKRRVIHQLAYDLAHARVRKYLEDGLDEDAFRAYGLQDPALELAFEAHGESYRLGVGNESEEPGLPFARRNLTPTLLMISGEMGAAQDLWVDEFIESNPVPDNYALLDSVRIVWQTGESITAFPGYRREWDLRPPPGWQGDPGHFLVSASNVFRGVEELESDRSVTLPSVAAAREYLATRKVQCELYWPDRTVSYRIGWRRGEDAHWLQIEGEKQVYRISRDLYFRLRGALLSAELLDADS